MKTSRAKFEAFMMIHSNVRHEKRSHGKRGCQCAALTDLTVRIEPMCYDPEGSRTLLQVDLHEAELRAKGTSEAEIKKDVANGYKHGRFKAPSRPGVEYQRLYRCVTVVLRARANQWDGGGGRRYLASGW